MTRDASPAPVSAPVPASAASAGRPADTARAPSTGRLVGIDLARGLAVFGMYAAHVGPDPEEDRLLLGGPFELLTELGRGRAPALFAVLAGFSLIILTGRPRPRTGRAGRQAVARVVIRSLLLLVVGYALVALPTIIAIILPCYGLFFLVVLPLYRLRGRTLAVLALTTALVMPQVLFFMLRAIDEGDWAWTIIDYDPLARITDTDGFIELLFIGEYPVITWVPFVLTGMAVARLDLRRHVVRARLALTGAALVVLGHGGSWLALHLVPNAMSDVLTATDGDSAAMAWWADMVGYPDEELPGAWLLVGAPHSQTTFSILGSAGLALLVLTLCVVVADRMPRLIRLLRPVCAVGMIALTAYAAHICVIAVLGMP
ncbi:heparan-alpha-glucosaminide N-acetyltransferase domain-containing protein, partial [Streptomyces minutiscleroticus]